MPATKPKSPRRKVTLYLHKDLFAAYSALCAANPRMQSPSREIQKLLTREVATRGKAFGIMNPEE